MSGPELFILIGISALVLSLNGSRFVLMELIEVVVLFKKLKATIRSDVSLQSPPPLNHTPPDRRLKANKKRKPLSHDANVPSRRFEHSATSYSGTPLAANARINRARAHQGSNQVHDKKTS